MPSKARLCNGTLVALTQPHFGLCNIFSGIELLPECLKKFGGQRFRLNNAVIVFFTST
jgi:hypothetical protein